MRRFSRAAVVLLAIAIVASLGSISVSAVGGPSGGFTLPAGGTAQFTGVGFSACNALTWGVELNGASQDQDSKGPGCFSKSSPDVTIGPFATPTTLRIFLRDDQCGATYYSDGTPVDHVIISGSASPYSVRFADGGGSCERVSTTANDFSGYNFTVQVAIRSFAVSAGGEYKTIRASAVTLHGSAQPPSADVTYRWQFSPGSNCPPGTVLKNASESGQSVTITPLCGLNVTLTGTDTAGDSATDTTTVTVDPRQGEFAETPVNYREAPLSEQDPRRPTDPPTVDNLNSGLTAGINVTDCDLFKQDARVTALLCPYVSGRSRQDGDGLSLSVLNDPGGPFDGDYYVGSTTLSIDRVGLFNIWMQPDSQKYPGMGRYNWFNRNVADHTANPSNVDDVYQFLLAVSAHEGFGEPGVAHSGHMQAIRDWIAAHPSDDPRHAIEGLFSDTAAAELTSVNQTLNSATSNIAGATRDPLAQIWQGYLDWFNGHNPKWMSGQTAVGPTD